MSDLDVSRYPVNERGFTVVPCIQLTFESMQEWMIGFKVTIGLEDSATTTVPGEILGYDEKKLHLRISGKEKKIEYNPADIQLQCYQFDKRILFSNEIPELKHEKRVDPPLEARQNTYIPQGDNETNQSPAKVDEDVDADETQSKPKRKRRKPKVTSASKQLFKFD